MTRGARTPRERRALLAFAHCVRNYNPFKACGAGCRLACEMVDWDDVVPADPSYNMRFVAGSRLYRMPVIAHTAESLALEGT